MAHKDEETEEKCVRQRTHHNNSQLLVHTPIGIVHLDLVPSPAQLNDRSVDDLEENPLADVVHDHPQLKHKSSQHQSEDPLPASTFLDTHIVDDLIENEVQFAGLSLLLECL